MNSAWVFLHRPSVYVAGAPADSPRYRFVCQVPEGQYNPVRRQAMTAAITAAVAKAENGAYLEPASRIWVFRPEIPDGTWGGFGQVFRLPDIAALQRVSLRVSTRNNASQNVVVRTLLQRSRRRAPAAARTRRRTCDRCAQTLRLRLARFG